MSSESKTAESTSTPPLLMTMMVGIGPFLSLTLCEGGRLREAAVPRRYRRGFALRETGATLRFRARRSAARTPSVSSALRALGPSPEPADGGIREAGGTGDADGIGEDGGIAVGSLL